MSDNIKQCCKWQRKGGKVLRVAKPNNSLLISTTWSFTDGAEYLCIKTSRKDRIKDLKLWFKNGGQIEFRNEYYKDWTLIVGEIKWHPDTDYRKRQPKPEPKEQPKKVQTWNLMRTAPNKGIFIVKVRRFHDWDNVGITQGQEFLGWQEYKE